MCGYSGCNSKGKYRLKQNIGKCQEIEVCSKHLPKWAINNEELEVMGCAEYGCYILKRI